MVGIRFVLTFLAVAGGFCALASAGCSSDAYAQACSSCSFDAGGKMDQACFSIKKASGTACLTSKYPIAYAQYAAGNCSAIDDCISELNSCKAQYETGNDRNDCAEGSVAVCFSAADVCVNSAAAKCTPGASLCTGAPAFILAGALAALGLASFTRR